MDQRRSFQSTPFPAQPGMPIGQLTPQQQQYFQQMQQVFLANPYAFQQQQQAGMIGRMPMPFQGYPPGFPNRGLPPNAQGLYSTYPARLKQSDDNALLLPSSYLANKKPRFATESDDDFDEYNEDSDEDGTPSSGMRTRSAAAAASAQVTQGATPGGGGQGPELRKIIRKKNHLYPNEKDLERASNMEEVLVPIRLDIDLDDVRLRDVFLWNMNEQFLTPEKFAEILCEDLELPLDKFVPPIAESIRSQVLDFEAIHEVELPAESIRVVINLDLQIGKVNLRDKFEWNLDNTASNAPEVFSKQLAAEVGLGGEYVSVIAHAIREQLYRHKRQWVDESLSEDIAEPLVSGFRNLEDAETWVPQMEMLSNEELEKLLIAQERNMRRLRRETRFKRSRRRLSVTPSRRTYDTP